MITGKLNIIREIAQELDCGNDCYFNLKTEEIVAIPNYSQVLEEEEFKEAFRDDIEKVEKHQSDFIKFEVLTSFESFKIMERFVGQLSDQKAQLELEKILSNKNPFRNFKHKIDYSDLRQSWFDFKQRELENRVEKQLEVEKSAYNKEPK